MDRVDHDALTEGRFKRHLRQDDRSLDALCGLAGIYLRRGWLEEALRLVRHALRQTQESAHVWSLLTQGLIARGRLIEAEESIQKALRIDPANAQHWVALGAVNSRLLRPRQRWRPIKRRNESSPAPVAEPVHRPRAQGPGKAAGMRARISRMHRAGARAPGEAYWSLADLKNYRFSDDEIAAMEGRAGAIG